MIIRFKNGKEKPERQEIPRFTRYILIVLWKIGLLTLSSCNYCVDSEGGENNGENIIIFSGIPLNDESPGIYSCSQEGTEVNTITSDGILNSEPSKDGILAYIRNSGNRTELRLISVNGTGDTLVINDLKVPEGSISYPVISPDAKWILFTGGRNTLYLIDSKGMNAFRISLFLAEETIPSFSGSGEFFAFYEKSGTSGSFRIRVFRTDNRKEHFSKSYSGGLKDFNGLLRIDWSPGNSEIMYSLRKSESDQICTNDINDQSYSSERIFEIDSSIGAEMPAYAPDSSGFVFVSRSGEIFFRNFSVDNPVFIQFTNPDENEVNRYPEWSPDAKSIIYNNYYRFDDQLYRASLVRLYDLDKGGKTMIISSNNIYRGFWGQN